MKTPLVSIITPVYNGEVWIEETIRSVLSQTMPDWELILVDDGSTDGSPSIIEQFSGDTRIACIRHEMNSGIPSARNSGLAAAKGRYIALLDQDDLWLPDKLEAQIELLESTPRCSLCYTRHAFFQRSGDNVMLEEVRYAPFHNRIDKLPEKEVISRLFMNNFIASGSVLIRTSALKTVGTFIEDITGGADDYELWLRLASCAPIVFLDRLTLLSRVHSKNYTDTIRITGDVLRILAKTARKCGISENTASASYERIRYKRCKAYIAVGDLSGAAEELNLAAEMGGWKPRYRFVRFLIGIGPAGRRAFTIFKDSAWHFHRIFRAGHVNITKTMSKTEFDRYITSASGQS